MNKPMKEAKARLEELLAASPITEGVYVRVYGDNLIVGRNESLGPDSEPEPSDRVRLTRLSKSTYGLSVKRHTGRWEHTPFSGSMKDMVEVLHTFMQHLVAAF